MRLNFEIKKILWSPLYCLLVLGFLGLAYLPISQRQVHQATYVETYKKELSELASVLAEIKIEEGSEEAPRMLGLKSDIESVSQALDEGKFEAIPNYRKLMYQDLDYFISRNRQLFQTRNSLTQTEVERLARWNDWLLEYQLPDGPENKAWSTGRIVQAYLESLFGFLPVFLVLGFLLANQLSEKTLAHQVWQLRQWDSLSLQGIRRLVASLLSLLLAMGIGLLFIMVYDGLTGQLAVSSFQAPLEILGQSQLIGSWLYGFILLGFWLVLLLAVRLLFGFLDHLLASRLTFVVTGLLLAVVLSYQAGAVSGWSGQVLPLLAFPSFLDTATFSQVFLQVDVFLLLTIGLFFAYYLLTEKKRLVLPVGHQKELETGPLDKAWSFEILILSRLNSWKGLVLVNLLLALLFSLLTGLEKQEVAQEERVSMELVAQSYEQDGVYVESLQSEINRLRQLVKEDASYQEELEWRVELLQEYHIYKDLYVKQWQVYQEKPQALPASHLAMLEAEQVYLWAREERAFANGDIGASQTVDNLRRYQTRNQVSQYYWTQLMEAGVPATKRGKDVILPSLENRFDTNDALVPVDDPSWDRSRDLSGIGSLRSLFDGPAYLVVLLLAVWIGSRGKAVEVAGKNWRLYQTQPVDLRQVLLTKWLLGLVQALGFTVFFLVSLFLGNSLVGGIGYLGDGLILLSHSERGIFLELLRGQELWAYFLPNAPYLLWMVLGLLVLEIGLVSLNHLLQVRFSNRLVVFILLIGLLALLDYLLFQDLILDGQEVFRQLALLFS
ncbi:ABC transporter permease [Streptococcus suis]|uniref:ABC transporter permease n=1 Tax=Streptococcus suis TaxID=1307 RepID=UPI0005CF364C|nr:ABC transporter permease [Streptococcus suis]NQH65140.1 ABC transporter permease [Streptococcus suis]CYU54684.1 ABC-2 family transporter protein [Streptococcus suis]